MDAFVVVNVRVSRDLYQQTFCTGVAIAELEQCVIGALNPIVPSSELEIMER
jgi:hypothetical protein